MANGLTTQARGGVDSPQDPATAIERPPHDDFGRLRQLFSVVSIAAAVALLIWNTARVGTTLNSFPWWLPLAVGAGMVAADFLSGLVHWSADTWGRETMPIIGRRLLHPFRVHHVNPDDFLRRRFIDTNGDVAFLIVPILLGATILPLDGTRQNMVAVFVVAFCAIGLLTNQMHQWAHMPAPPLVVSTLQDWGVILSRSAHERHHRTPYDVNYCIATGWCNRPLAAIDFFRRLERAVTAVTGLQPREDDSVFEAESRRRCQPPG